MHTVAAEWIITLERKKVGEVRARPPASHHITTPPSLSNHVILHGSCSCCFKTFDEHHLSLKLFLDSETSYIIIVIIIYSWMFIITQRLSEDKNFITQDSGKNMYKHVIIINGIQSVMEKFLSLNWNWPHWRSWTFITFPDQESSLYVTCCGPLYLGHGRHPLCDPIFIWRRRKSLFCLSVCDSGEGHNPLAHCYKV